MPFAPGVYRSKFTFLLGTLGEIAVMTLATRYAGGEAEPTVTSQINHHVASQWSSHCGPVKTRFSTIVHLNHIDTYKLGTDGRALTKATSVFDGADQPAWSGTDTGSSLPWECAVVISLNANSTGYDPHAARKRGRFYLPPPAAVCLAGDGQGRLATGSVDNFSNTMFAFLEGVNDIPAGLGSQCRVIVASKAAAANYDVVSMHADDRVDAQRRRENRQPDSYTKTNVLAP